MHVLFKGLYSNTNCRFVRGKIKAKINTIYAYAIIYQPCHMVNTVDTVYIVILLWLA